MRRGVTVVFFMSLLLSCFPASVRAETGQADWAADERVIRAILFLTGAPDIETLSEEELEKWWDLAESPLQINLVPPSVIEKSGLMSMYQAASFAHYRAHSGDVLSCSELASIDGFGEREWPKLSLPSSRWNHPHFPAGARGSDAVRAIHCLSMFLKRLHWPIRRRMQYGDGTAVTV